MASKYQLISFTSLLLIFARQYTVQVYEIIVVIISASQTNVLVSL